ncbi:MAG: beta-glucosidase [Phycisphaerales bacterium]|nr:beta-glucosidase [Phycisphaerales bacterium]
MRFPEGFEWGVAAAAYQIEGAADADGRGPSIWDTFAQTPQRVFHGHTGARACDHFHRFAEDADLIAGLGARAYRLSVSWPRVLPEGTGKVNEAGLGFYDRLVDALLARGVTPWITLFHWDMPQAVFDRGGWLNRASADWFAEFAAVMADRLGDRVKHWFTINEPQVFLGLGHAGGEHAPGMRYALPEVLRACHHVLLAHGRAVSAIRAQGKQARVGWAPHGSIRYPLTVEPADVEAARRATLGIPAGDDWYFNTSWYADPALLGYYPEEGIVRFGSLLPTGFEDDYAAIHQPLDFFGVNIYQGHPTRADEAGNAVEQPRPPGYPHTMFHWPVEPEVLYWGPKFLHERYRLPIYITENGCAAMDWVHADGAVHDAPRVDYLCRHLLALRRAIADGADVRGYFHWSILDNFEWAEGYRMRFGLVYVDYATLERIPKDSYRWYQQVIRTNGACLPENPAPLR